MLVKIKKHRFLIICIFIFALFWLSGLRGLDPDFGWHLRLGEIILKSGIPATDPFSYSMSTYPIVDHEWLTNIAIASLYPKIGISGLTFVFIAIAFVAVFLQTLYLKRKYLIFPFILSQTAMIDYLGIRPQILSWFFISSLLLLFINPKLWQKLRFFIPILMLLWVNLHAGFALGIGLLGLVVVKQLKTKQLLLSDWIVVFLSIAATFVNPYGGRVWWEVWMQMSDAGLRWSIQEWFPAFFFFNVGFMFLLPISLTLVLRYRKKFQLHTFILYIVLLFFGLSGTRHLPFWLLIAIPMTTQAIEYFIIEIKTIPFARKRLKIASIIFFTIFAVIFSINTLITLLPFKYSVFEMYPEAAVYFLQAHPSRGNVFAHYNWGGYLVWKYREKKVFIDGIMPSWRQEYPPSGSSSNAFKEYLAVMDGKSNLKQFLAKYNIDTVMIGSGDDKDFPIWLEDAIEKTLGVKFPNQKSLKKQLEKEGMRVVYKDDVAVVYRK
jgi:hypothetical protein